MACGLLLMAVTGCKPEYDGHKLWFQAEHDGKSTVVGDTEGIVAQTATAELSTLGIADTFVLKIVGAAPCGKAPSSESFRIVSEGNNYVVEAGGESGLLYAAYYIRRNVDLDVPFTVSWQTPYFTLRMLNHWDNLDGTVERGYAGRSLWQWDELPAVVSPRYAEYARANASIGINAVVLNNVNASPEILTSDYISKVRAIADVLRPYAQRVFLAVNFSSPMAFGATKDADPLRPEVREWWQRKADEIYDSIPDFGGFLVKANSEGLPGPLDYGRSHAEGANMLASALEPHGGFVLWRAFVYSPSDADRAKQAYIEFAPHDGEFAQNVIIQIKNGPIDFQPREPISPLFGAMPHTRIMAEVQVTQEYTGHANQLCFLAPMWQEALQTDTYAHGQGSSVARVTRGTFNGLRPSAIAGVANIGDDDNWCGHPFAQANWYAFGRMAWNPNLPAEGIAHEWICLTLGNQLPKENVKQIAQMMCQSREAVVDYMMPLGLHHLFAWGHHYGPEPWCDVEGARPDWMPSYYHRADSLGLGFDRSPSGSNATAQYHEPLASLYASKKTCPIEFLLWFHHVGWSDVLPTGHNLWQELCLHYDHGLDAVRNFEEIWQQQRPYVDDDLWSDVADRLHTQSLDALWWHDACLLYFQTFSRMPLMRPTELDLDSMKAFHLDISNFESAPTGFRK